MIIPAPRFFDPAPLLPYLEDGWQVITPNSRLASRVRLSVVDYHMAKTARPVKMPAIESLKNWLDDVWQQALIADDPAVCQHVLENRLLTPDQELLLWQQIINRSADAANLLDAKTTARDVMRARQWLWQWQIDLNDSTVNSYFISREHQAALGWFREFDHYCAKQKWMTREARNSYLTDVICSGKLTLDRKILLLGFAEMSPRDHALMQAMTCWETLPLSCSATQRQLISFDRRDDELLAFAQWAKQRLENSGDRIALVVPDLTARRAEIVRVLQQVLQPEQLAVDSDWHIPPFNISAGESLGSLPIARIALSILRLAFTQLQRAEWQIVFASPYFSLASEDHAFVARVLKKLADTRSEALKSSTIRQCIQSSATENHQLLLDGLFSAATLQRQSSAKKSASQWAVLFRQTLQALQWPGKRGLQSIDYQQYQHCMNAIDLFARADFLLPQLNAAEAIAQFGDVLQAQVFQPQSSDARLQILGTLEAAGLQFDAIWLLGMDEMHWPPAASPNAYLPFALQIEKHMPRASAQRELTLATTLTEQLLGSSPQIIASYCAIQDEAHYQSSQLLQDFETADLHALGLASQPVTPLQSVQQNLSAINVLHRDAGNAPVYHSAENVRGGSRIINDQSQCPFRSFVVHRLQGESLESAGYAFDQREQGNVLHKALEDFWSDLPDQAALKALSEQQLHERCEASIANALNVMAQDLLRRGVVFGPVLQQLEAQRVKTRMLQWLQEEKYRPVFSVFSREESVTLKLSDLDIRLRADRIDQLADNSLMVIDYKTGLSDKPVHWLGDRPENLQLPLYAVQLSEQNKPVAALAFAKIHAEKTLVDGLGRDEQTGVQARYQIGGTVGGKKDTPPVWFVDDWSTLLDHWKKTVHGLAEEFCRGESRIAPLKPPATCNYCELKPACRFHLDRFINEEDDDDDGLIEQGEDNV